MYVADPALTELTRAQVSSALRVLQRGAGVTCTEPVDEPGRCGAWTSGAAYDVTGYLPPGPPGRIEVVSATPA